jgi:hypothetical protein
MVCWLLYINEVILSRWIVCLILNLKTCLVKTYVLNSFTCYVTWLFDTKKEYMYVVGMLKMKLRWDVIHDGRVKYKIWN